MKGQTESYSFLIGIIITLLILLPLGIFVYNYLESKTLTETCFEKIEPLVSMLQDGEKKNVICTIGGGKALVSFNPGKDSVSSFLTSLSVSYYWHYPDACEGACICACKKESALGELVPFSREEDCNEKGEKCFPVEWAKEIQGQVLQKPLFAAGSLKPLHDDFFTHDDGSYNFVVERKGFILGICTKSPCIQEKTPRTEALVLFQRFVMAYNKTKQVRDEECIGESFDFSSLPEGYAIELMGSYGKPIEIKLIDEEDAVLDSFVVPDDQLCALEFNNQSGDFEKNNIHLFRIGEKGDNSFVYRGQTDFSYEATYQLFHYNGTFTCFVQDTDHRNFEKIRSLRQFCENKEQDKQEELF